MLKFKSLILLIISFIFLSYCASTEEESSDLVQGDVGEFSDIEDIKDEVSEVADQSAIKEEEEKYLEKEFDQQASQDEALEKEFDQMSQDLDVNKSSEQLRSSISNQDLQKEPEQSISESNNLTNSNENLEVKYPDQLNLSPESSKKQFSSATKVTKNKIIELQYRSNDLGGTFIIHASGTIDYYHKYDDKLNQLIVELNNVSIPRNLQRPFSTKDFPGGIAFIDVFKLKGSSSARVVVQLRPGYPQPIIQAEDKSIYIISQVASNFAKEIQLKNPEDLLAESSSEKNVISTHDQNYVSKTNVSSENEKSELPSILDSLESFESFLRTNKKFSGKKISIETDDIDLKTLFGLIGDETGINFLISDSVSGKISLKLKSVPWDEVLVMILKAKRLGYTRSGNIFRIAPINEIRAEEEEALKIELAKKNNQPILMKSIPINYASVTEIENRIRTFLTPQKGSLFVDNRTSTIIISDYAENIEKIEKVLKSIDIPPHQVLIEGRIVEANDEFEKNLGINWSAPGRSINLGNNLRMSTGVFFNSGIQEPFSLDFRLGTLNFLGNLNATLAYFERENFIKVISSPRILTLHNQRAEISENTQIPIINSNVTPTGGVTTNVSFQPSELRLEVTPQVTNDGSVLLNVTISRQFPGTIVDTQTKARPINTRSARTQVLLKNAQTAVIGGIYQNDVTEGEGRIPGLSKMPLIGRLFRANVHKKARNELLIFLTPRILGNFQGISHQNNALSDDKFSNSTSLINPNSQLSNNNSLQDLNQNETNSLDKEFENLDSINYPDSSNDSQTQ